MATFYIDYENGSSTADGTSVANKRSQMSGLSGIAAGDTIKIAGSPNPTLIGTGDVQQGKHYPYYDGRNNGTITYSTTGNQTNIYYYDHDLLTDDTIIIYQNTHGENINGTWEVARIDDNNFKIKNFTASINGTASSGSNGKWMPTSNKRIMLDSPCTKNLVSCGKRSTAWTAATDVTTALVEDTSPEWNSSSRKTIEHNYVDQITVSANHGTGLAAYKSSDNSLIAGNGNDPDYHQISFMICQTSGTYTDGVSIRATNSSGTTSLRTVPIDFTNSWNYAWFPVTLDFGESIITSGMSNLTEISLYIDTDHGARTFLISNVIACKDSSEADSLTHHSLIGLNTTADPCWYPIESINGSRVMIWTGKANGSPNGYYGAGRNVGFSADFDGTNIYKRETIKANHLRSLAQYNSTQVDYLNVTGVSTSSASPLTVSGGWSSDFSTQNLEYSLVDITNSTRGTFTLSGYHIHVERLGLVRFGGGLKLMGGPYTIDDLGITAVHDGYCFNDQSGTEYKKLNIDWVYNSAANRIPINGYCVDSSGNVATSADKANFNANIYCINASSACLMYQGTQGNGFIWNNLNIHGAGYYAPSMKWNDNTTGLFYVHNLKITCGYNGIYRTNGSGGCTFQFVNATFKNMDGYLVQMNKSDKYLGETFTESVGGNGKLWQAQADAIQINGTVLIQLTNGPTLTTQRMNVQGNAILQTQNDSITGNYASSPLSFGGNTSVWQRRDANQVSGAVENHYKHTVISPNTSIRKTASGYSWKVVSGNFANPSSGSPAAIELGTIAVNASSLVTVKVWTYRTNANVIGRLKVKQSTLIGLTSDSTAVTSGNINEWVEISTTFTPTASGFADIALEAYDGPGYFVYFDDLTVTQA